MTEVVIVSGKRTAIGSFQGQFSEVSAPELASAAIRAVIDQTGIPAEDVSEVLMGNVLAAGLGQAPARQAALGAGLPNSVGCVGINKVCGSAMKTLMLGHDMLVSGSASVILAGGMESMTNAPYLLPKARKGLRMGHGQTLDHMFFDGLQSPFDGNMMGVFGEATAARYELTREDQDAFAVASVGRALDAAQSGAFDEEIAPVTVKTRTGEQVIVSDEEPPNCRLDKIPKLRPAFAKDGTVTAATSSKISDGAAATLLMTRSEADKRGLTPLATLVGHATHAHEPEWFTTAPAQACQKLLSQLGWQAGDVDLWEINEAFAAVTMAAMKDLNLDPAKVNVNGGACALGHPIGATGSRIVITLMHALRRRGLKRGIASLCLGGGEATAVALEIR
ncbi:MAG: acetyl-CoA C-acyltransferase [Lysobacterales bacterium]